MSQDVGESSRAELNPKDSANTEASVTEAASDNAFSTYEQPSRIKALINQFIKFGIVGASNTLISLAVYYVFVWIDEGLYLWGNVAGWAVSVLNAFYWGNRVVFKQQSNTKKELLARLLKSYISYGGTFLLSQLLLWLEVRYWGISEWLAPIVNLLLTIPLNFIINKLWTFRK